MTPEQRRHIEEIIEHWAPLLGLSDWTISVRGIKPKKTLYGQAHAANHGYRSAVIKINPDPAGEFWSGHFPLEETVVHELLHLSMWEEYNFKEEVQKLLPDGAQEFITGLMRRHMETNVEMMARALVAARYGRRSVGAFVGGAE